MNKDQSLQQELDLHYKNAAILFELIKADIKNIAQDVCKANKYTSDQELLNVEHGCYEAYVRHLVMTLQDKDIEKFIKYLEEKK